MSTAEQKMRIRKAQLRARRTGDTSELERLFEEQRRSATANQQAIMGRIEPLLQLIKNKSMSDSERHVAAEQLLEDLPDDQRQMIDQIVRANNTAGYGLDALSNPATGTKKKRRRKRKKKKNKSLPVEDDSEPEEPVDDASLNLHVGEMTSIETMME